MRSERGAPSIQRMRSSARLLPLIMCLVAACDGQPDPDAGAAPTDARVPDGGRDADVVDAEVVDAGLAPPSPVLEVDFADRTRTVDPERATEGAGTDEDPWNPRQAMALAAPGDVVGWLPGVAVGDPSLGESRYQPAFQPQVSGTADAPIVHVAQNLAALTSAGRTELRSGVTEAGAGRPAFGVEGVDYVQWIGFLSDESAADNAGVNDSAPAVLWSTTGSSIRYCELIGVDGVVADNHSGVRVEGVFDVVVSDNVIHGFQRSGGSTVNQAAVISYGTRRSVFEHNHIYDVTHGMQIKGHELWGFEIRFNHVHDVTDFMRIHGMLEGPGGEISTIRQNLVERFTRAFEFTTSATQVGEPDGIVVAHNLFIEQRGSAYGVLWLVIDPLEDGAVPRNIRFFNNIMADIEGGQLGANFDGLSELDALGRFSSNAYHGHRRFFFNPNSGSSPLNEIPFETWRTEHGQDEGSLLDDPGVVRGDDGGYALREDSPCRGAGVDHLDLRGAGTDAPIDLGPFVAGDETFGVRAP